MKTKESEIYCDCRIFGISENSTLSDLKIAYRKKVKEFHPDLIANKDKIESHLLMIRINHAYNNLRNRFQRVEYNNITQKSAKSDKDFAYEFYKRGIDIYHSIHPSKWHRMRIESFFTKGSEEAENKRNASIIEDLVKLLPDAYYYFSVIMNEFPQSIWAGDSKKKMVEIEKMTVRYTKIIESYQ